MVTVIAKVSRKNQVVLPKEVREQLGVKAGDNLLFVVREGEVIVRARPASFTKAMRGLHKHVRDKLDVDRWLAEERQPWK
jgi:AbrB family looped-hinge helix DNA binding protein